MQGALIAAALAAPRAETIRVTGRDQPISLSAQPEGMRGSFVAR